jgi:molybdopterin synthase sulfur carrier subunit
MVTLRLFASIREVAGTGTAEFEARTVGDLIDQASAKFGESFVALLPSCRVWVNGEPAERSETVESGDEVALLPPVSGGQVSVRES